MPPLQARLLSTSSFFQIQSYCEIQDSILFILFASCTGNVYGEDPKNSFIVVKFLISTYSNMASILNHKC